MIITIDCDGITYAHETIISAYNYDTYRARAVITPTPVSESITGQKVTVTTQLHICSTENFSLVCLDTYIFDIVPAAVQHMKQVCKCLWSWEQPLS